jgi:hypothetical protein
LVKAAADGIVAYASDELRGHGVLVMIRHSDGWVTAYAYNSEDLGRSGNEGVPNPYRCRMRCLCSVPDTRVAGRAVRVSSKLQLEYFGKTNLCLFHLKAALAPTESDTTLAVR